MKVITYTRISTEIQDLASQQLELDAHCARNGWAVVARLSDVMTGTKAARPGIDEVISRCEAGGIDAVVVVKLDRLGRSVLNVVSLIDKLAKMGTAIICISQGIDTRESNPCGRVTYQILAAVSEFERSLISERTKAGLAVARVNGKIIGQISKILPKTDEERKKIVIEWLKGGDNSYDRLGEMLGGVSRSTAWRIAKKFNLLWPSMVPPEIEV